jgi:antitoxin (DNA-binding transcriptional repressor) of toxin-antitoxin stability system
MKSLGVRQAKAHLSALVRAAASGECSLVTDNGRLVAMIGPAPQDPAEAHDPSPAPTEKTKPFFEGAKFHKALLGVPFPLELDL